MRLISDTAAPYGFTAKDMIGRRLDRPANMIRHLVYFEVRRLRTHLSYPDIGRLFDGRDHTTILWGVAQHEARMLWVEVLKGCVPGAGDRLELFR